MTQSLPQDKLEFYKNVELDDILNAEDDIDKGYFLEVDINYPLEIKEKRSPFPFCPENKLSPQDVFCDYANKTKS